jgi:methionyl-tRNA formyltransferase
MQVKMNNSTFPNIAFFGTPQIAVWVLEELEKGGVIPSLVVTNPDAPRGRKMIMTPSPVSDWAEARNIEIMKPLSLKSPEVYEQLIASGCELFIVAAYGKMIPENILAIPKYKTLNMHPSLLPKLRGASPIRSAILGDMNPTGVTIMELTVGMDEGPLLAQEEVSIEHKEWPLRGTVLDELLARKGGILFLETLAPWIAGQITPCVQTHSEATYSTKITKEMGHIDLHDDPYQNMLKIRAFDGWPGTYFFHEKNDVSVRVKIVDAELFENKLNITRVIPEGKKEMSFEDFIRS